MRDDFWPSGAIAGQFDDEDAFVRAVSSLADSGYVRLETYSPYEVPRARVDHASRRSRLPLAVFAGGVVGAAAGYAIQWYANVASYPLDIGGRPVHATAAFIIPSFEAAVLCAALVAFVGVLWSVGLPRPWHPMFEADEFERASIDRYWIAVDARDALADRRKTVADLLALGASRVEHVPPIE